VKFGVEERTEGNMSPLRGEKPQNRPLSKLNTGAAPCVSRNAAGKNSPYLATPAPGGG